METAQSTAAENLPQGHRLELVLREFVWPKWPSPRRPLPSKSMSWNSATPQSAKHSLSQKASFRGSGGSSDCDTPDPRSNHATHDNLPAPVWVPRQGTKSL